MAENERTLSFSNVAAKLQRFKMSYPATVLKVMIASPGDVAAERQTIRDVIIEWNHIHSEDRGLVLMPISWETHSTPTMGDRPQAIINKQVLANCDLLVAAFWTRLGSPTGVAASGTVEEIDEHRSAGKPAMLYFSSAPVHPQSVDATQYAALTEFKNECIKKGLIESYESLADFRDKFSRQLRAYLKTEPSVSSCVVQEVECFWTGTEVDDGDGVVGEVCADAGENVAAPGAVAATL